LSWYEFTWLGDSGLLLPAAALIALWLLVARATWPAALLWVIVFGTGSSLVLLSKLAFMGWGVGSARFDFTGFSGHTTLSASVWPVALWLMASRSSHAVRVTLACAGWVLALGIGLSRLVIQAHSIAEVAAGFLLGAGVSVVFLAIQHSRPHPRLHWPLVALSLALPLVVLRPGSPAPTQDLLERIAMRLAGTDRVFTRDDLHKR
jgi:membrane-associated phospholipid phosphatase